MLNFIVTLYALTIHCLLIITIRVPDSQPLLVWYQRSLFDPVTGPTPKTLDIKPRYHLLIMSSARLNTFAPVLSSRVTQPALRHNLKYAKLC